MSSKWNVTENSSKDAEVGGFTVLGKIESKEKEKVSRVLPIWLTLPTVIKSDLRANKTEIENIPGIHPVLIETLKSNDITHFFPVQSTVIPWLLKSMNGDYRPNDICVSAPTGSGKTLAFVLPLIQVLKERVVMSIRALVLLPVRDLAKQVFKVFEDYSRNTNIKVGLAVGEKSFAAEQASLVRQSSYGFRSMVDILVATPGRLVDHIQKTPGFSLNNLKFLVIDEADRMMETVHQNWLQYIDQHILSNLSQKPLLSVPGIMSERNIFPPTAVTPISISQWSQVPQKLLFSATLSQNPEKLEEMKLFQPKLFTSVTTVTSSVKKSELKPTNQFIGKYTTPAELEECYIECEMALKPLILFYLLERKKCRHVLCFTNSVETTKRLYLLIKEMSNLNVRQMSSSLSALKRNKILRDFKNGEVDIIIASDVLARGMDIENIDYVISYEVPQQLKKYIHRIGRTARAGRPGTAISLLNRREIPIFKKFLKSAGKNNVSEMKINSKHLMQYEAMFKSALDKIKMHL